MAIDVITYRAPAVYPGDLTRTQSPFTTETGIQLAANPVTLFGVPVQMDITSGHYQPATASTVTQNNSGATPYNTIVGFSVRTFPTQSASNGSIGTAGPLATDTLTILKEGYIGVSVYGSGTAPVKGGPVYVGIVANAGVTAVGRVSSAADSTNSILILGAHFTGGVDSNGNSEIFFRAESNFYVANAGV